MLHREWWPLFILLLFSLQDAEKLTINAVGSGVSWAINPDGDIDSIGRSYLVNVITYLQSFLSSPNLVRQNCSHAILETFNGFITGEYWARQMLDAAGKIPSDLLNGAWTWLGSYSECLDVKGYNDSFNGLYCLAYRMENLSDFDPYTPRIDSSSKFLRYGFCVPDICNSEEIQNLTNEVAILLDLPPPKVICQQRELKLGEGVITVLFICGVFIFLLLVGTLYDLCIYQPYHQQASTIFRSIKVTSSSAEEDAEDKPLLFSPKPMGGSIVDKNPSVRPNIIARVCLSFSVNTNFGKILNTEGKENSFPCINGVKVLSMFWLILGHSYLYSFNIFSNPKAIESVIKSFSFQIVLSSHIAVDSFFLISGTLVCYLLLNDARRKEGYVNWLAFYFHRFWRLTPTYMLVLGFYVTVFRYIGNGPMWPQNGVDTNNCVDTWWTNLLYINNLVDSRNMCLKWSWYLANDMQFHVVSPVILLTFLKLDYLAVGLIMTLIMATCLATGIFSSISSFPPGILTGNISHPIDMRSDSYYLINIRPYFRIGPYLVGLLLGYILFKYEHRPILKNKFLILFFWLASISCNMAVVFGLYRVAQGHTMDNDIAALYNSLYHTVWGVSLAWVIFGCIKGYGGVINGFLSWKIWFPLSKLSYCVYLIHPMVIIAFYQSKQSLDTFTHPVVIYYFLGTTVLSYSIALVLSLVLETPLISLEKIFLKKDEWRS